MQSGAGYVRMIRCYEAGEGGKVGVKSCAPTEVACSGANYTVEVKVLCSPVSAKVERTGGEELAVVGSWFCPRLSNCLSTWVDGTCWDYKYEQKLGA